MDVSTVESLATSVVTPIQASIVPIAAIGLGLFATVMGIKYIPRIIKALKG